MTNKDTRPKRWQPTRLPDFLITESESLRESVQVTVFALVLCVIGVLAICWFVGLTSAIEYESHSPSYWEEEEKDKHPEVPVHQSGIPSHRPQTGVPTT
jgi:hypothetical protein